MPALTIKKHKATDASQQISEKAAMQVAGLHTALRNLQFDQDQARAERARILSEQAQRADQRNMFASMLADLEAKHRAALAYAEVAQGTVGEQEAVKQASELQKQLAHLRATVADRHNEYSAADEQATARLAELDTSMRQWSEEEAVAHARIQEIEQVRDQAQKELGLQTFDTEMQRYHELQARIDAAKSALAALMVERHQAIAASAEKLKAWQNLRLQVLALEPHDDATTRIITACRDYLARLQADRLQLRDSLGIEAVSAYFTWWQLLNVEEPTGYNALKSTSGQEALQNHIAKLEQVLEAYRTEQTR